MEQKKLEEEEKKEDEDEEDSYLILTSCQLLTIVSGRNGGAGLETARTRRVCFLSY